MRSRIQKLRKVHSQSPSYDRAPTILPSMEPGRIPNYVIKVKGVLAICPISYKAAATSSPPLPASINRLHIAHRLRAPNYEALFSSESAIRGSMVWMKLCTRGISAGLPSYRGYLVIDPFACEAYHRFVLFPYALMITDSNCCNKPPPRYEVREYLCYRARASTTADERMCKVKFICHAPGPGIGMNDHGERSEQIAGISTVSSPVIYGLESRRPLPRAHGRLAWLLLVNSGRLQAQVASWVSIALKDGSCFFTLQVAEASVQPDSGGGQQYAAIRDATEDDTGGAFSVSRHEPPTIWIGSRTLLSLNLSRSPCLLYGLHH
ncbi:hypothetical protein LguiB_036290 [Lonicera macranthoides]